MTKDILITLIGYIVTVCAVLLWTFRSKQDRVPRTRRTAVMVSVRTLPLFLVFLLICHVLNVSVLAAVLSLTLFLLCVFFLMGPGGLGPTLGVLGVLYVLKQWILGWPDKQDMVLEPPSIDSGDMETLSGLIGQHGVTSSALRPAGDVTVAGQKYAAVSDLGYIEAGYEVAVVGRRGPQLVVRLSRSEEKGPLYHP